jgi:hypothetical protein
VAPKVFKLAKEHSDVTFLRINFDEFPEFCTYAPPSVYSPPLYLHMRLGEAFSFHCPFPGSTAPPTQTHPDQVPYC